MGEKKKIPLLTKLLIAMVIGIILGAIFGEKITVIKPFGSVFLNLLKMAALPLIVVNLIAGISSLNDPKIFGRVGVKILCYYALTTVLAIIVGIFTGYLFHPGVGFMLQGEYKGVIEKIPSFGETIIGLTRRFLLLMASPYWLTCSIRWLASLCFMLRLVSVL